MVDTTFIDFASRLEKRAAKSFSADIILSVAMDLPDYPSENPEEDACLHIKTVMEPEPAKIRGIVSGLHFLRISAQESNLLFQFMNAAQEVIQQKEIPLPVVAGLSDMTDQATEIIRPFLASGKTLAFLDTPKRLHEMNNAATAATSLMNTAYIVLHRYLGPEVQLSENVAGNLLLLLANRFRNSQAPRAEFT